MVDAPQLTCRGQSLSFYLAELLKRTDTRTHVRAKFSRICAIFLLLNANLAKQALFPIFGTLFFQILYVFLIISVHNSAQNFIKVNSDRAKKITLEAAEREAQWPNP